MHLGSLSGTPLFQARLLLEGHDLLLLDEPTNHLDAQSVAWLQSYLEGFKGTVVAITRDRDFLEKSCGSERRLLTPAAANRHDRYFLEKSCGWILELERGEGKPFEGNYAEWLEQKAEAMRQERKAGPRLQRRYGEIWGDMGRYGEIWGSRLQRTPQGGAF